MGFLDNIQKFVSEVSPPVSGTVKEKELDRMGIEIHVLLKIIQALNENDELKMIFGEQVSDHLAIVAEGKKADLRIEHNGRKEISQGQALRFEEILGDVIQKTD
jgi:hypothetical protein